MMPIVPHDPPAVIAPTEVTAYQDGAGRVRIRVDIVNELPWVVGGRVGGAPRRRARALGHGADLAHALVDASSRK